MSKPIAVVVASLLAGFPLNLALAPAAAAQDLQSFGVISGQSLTNTGPTTIVGNIAVSPGSSYTGSGSVTQTGEVFLGDAVALREQNDLTTLYTFLAGRPTASGGDLTGQDLGGMTLSAGVYNFDSSAGLAVGQTLTLDGGGNPDAIFVFNIGSTLTVGSGASVVLQNEAQGGNVFYRIGSSATLDTTADMQGQIVALTSITLNTSASINCGAAFARNGSVTLDSNLIQICTLAGQGFDTAADNPDLTLNPDSVATALSNHVAGGGVLPTGLAILAATQTPEELAANLSGLAGEGSTGVGPMGLQSVDAFLDTVIRSGDTPRGQTMAPRREGVPVGLVPEKINGTYTGKYGRQDPEAGHQPPAHPPALAPQSRNWDVWAAGYGARNTTDGDAAMGAQERTSATKGLAAGLNFAPNDRTNVGIALSGNSADFALSNGSGTGTGESVFVALRGRTSSDRAYVKAALAYGRSDITTDRTVTIAGVDRFTAKTTADTVAAHIEAGYKTGSFTPFVGLRAKSVKTPAYAETTVAGSSSYALQYDAQTTTSLRSELGVDLQWSNEMAGGSPVVFGIRAAWAHEFATNEPGTRAFQTVPGAAFAVSGATQDRDSLLLVASVRMAARSGFAIDGALNLQLSQNTRDFGGSVTAHYRW